MTEERTSQSGGMHGPHVYGWEIRLMTEERTSQSGGGQGAQLGRAEVLGGSARRETLNPPGVHTPQANYSHVTRVGNTLYVSGQVPLDLEGGLVGRGDAEAQAAQCFRNIEAICKHFGGSLENVVKLTTFITNWAFRALVANARDRALGPPYPASTLVVISALASPDFLVEIEAIAVLED